MQPHERLAAREREVTAREIAVAELERKIIARQSDLAKSEEALARQWTLLKAGATATDLPRPTADE